MKRNMAKSSSSKGVLGVSFFEKNLFYCFLDLKNFIVSNNSTAISSIEKQATRRQQRQQCRQRFRDESVWQTTVTSSIVRCHHCYLYYML